MKNRLFALASAGLITCFLGAATSLHADLNSSLVAYYPFDGDAHDATGNGHDGTTNGVIFVADRFGCANSAVRFDGVDDYILIGDFDFNQTQRSVAFWVKPDSDSPLGQAADFISKHADASNVELLIRTEKDGKYDAEWTIGGVFHDLSANAPGVDDAIGLATPTFSSWDFLTLVYDGTQIRFYLNAQPIRSVAASGSVYNNSLSMHFGNYAGASNQENYKGLLDDVRIYNRALSASEVQQLYLGVGDMVLVPAGSFQMGDTFGEGNSDERPVHTVYISAFYMDKYEVSKSLWDDVYNWAIAHGYSFDSAGAGKAASHPVQTVSWYDCVKWCNARSEKESLTPCYYTSAAKTIVYQTGDLGMANDWVNWSASGYRLPTEAEWEKAARGGSSGHRFPWSNVDTITHSQANYHSESSYAYDISPTRGYHPTYAVGGYPYTSPVGSFAANDYGLYDMAGNVAEWCWDWYDGAWYGNAGATQNDTQGPTSGDTRLLRGGNWPYRPSDSRVAFRYGRGYSPDLEIYDVGFRCVRSSLGSLSSIAIAGTNTVSAGSVTPYTCIATFSDGVVVDVSAQAKWDTVGSVPSGTGFSDNNLTVGSNVSNNYPISIRATYTNGSQTAVSQPFMVTIQPVFTVQFGPSYLQCANGQQQVAFHASSYGPNGEATSYSWDLNGDGVVGDASGSTVSTNYPTPTGSTSTRLVRVQGTDSAGQTATAQLYVPINKCSDSPTVLNAVDVLAGAFFNPTGGTFTFDPAKRDNGLLIITHGTAATATDAWLTNMAAKIQTRLTAESKPQPNLCLFDWSLMADPSKFDGSSGALEKLYDFTFVLPYAIAQGIILADWIKDQAGRGNIDLSKPIQIIGHSAGGDLAQECSLALKANTVQVTLLDTPFPDDALASGLYGKVERYPSSFVGGGRAADLPGIWQWEFAWEYEKHPCRTDCKIGTCPSSCFLFQEIVAQNSSYHRTLALSGDFFFGFKIASAHRYSHEWYTETVQNTGSLDGFYYSPWLDHSFPSLLMAQGRVGALMTHEEQIAEFSTFGNVAISNGTYTITEATDAGIYKLFTLPVGARSLKFRYRFTSAGDGDFLSVHWGANAVLYVGPDLPVSRDNFIDADVPVAAYAGQTDQLVFKLVSRGTTNAVLVVDSIALSIDDDPDGDELTTDQEIALGTDPLKYDTDGDGLSDGDEVNIYHTNPLVADTDGDGMSDGQEVIAGTDPNDPSSVFQITSIQFADGTITLTWPSATGKSYSVYGTTDLSWNDFTTLTNGVAATPPTNSFADVPPASLPNFFYRVGVSQ